MAKELAYAVETLRNEYYRIALDIRSVPAEQWSYGFSDKSQRESQAQLVEAMIALGATITTDMSLLVNSVKG